MDIYCPRCTEPWDNDELHERADEIDSTYSKVAADFRRRGCVVFTDTLCPKQDSLASMAIAELGDILGDDMDGLSATLEDFGLV